MRTLFLSVLAFLPLVQAQDSRLVKSVEPKYGEDLAANFDTVSASVTMTIRANGKPHSLDGTSVPLPMAVVLALQGYEFLPQTEFPHRRLKPDEGSFQVTLNVPVRQSKTPSASPNAVRVGPGISKGLLIQNVRPAYSEDAKRDRIQGPVALEAVVGKQGDVEHLQIIHGPLALIGAAFDAVRQWQYRPYRVDREQVEMLTTIEVNFALP